MRRTKILPPVTQQTFPFARNDTWQSFPVPARDDCRRLLMQQLKQCLEFEDRQEKDHEREDQA